MQKYYSGDGLFFVMPQQQSCTGRPDLAASAGRLEDGFGSVPAYDYVCFVRRGRVFREGRAQSRLTLTLRAFRATVPACGISTKSRCFGFSVYDSLGDSRLDRAMSRDLPCELDILFFYNNKKLN